MQNIDDIRDFDAFLKKRIVGFREKLQGLLSPHRLTLAEARVSRVLIPMVGVYTPGWQALPACSWEFVELVTKQGPVGSGEWSIALSKEAQGALVYLREHPAANLLDLRFEEPLFMAWWDLVGQVLKKPLHILWSELVEREAPAPTRVPMAAYTWQRFPDMHGKGGLTYKQWPRHAAERSRQGFPSIKVSMTGYQPEDYIELIHNIRAEIEPETMIRIDTHGTWNFQEARRILPAVRDCNLEFVEQPFNSLLPQCNYPKGALPGGQPPERGYQAEYYFRKMTELRRDMGMPFSCHWWTPPIIHPPGATEMSCQWEPNWYMLERYDAADVSAPDIGLGVWGLWRIAQLARFMGMHITVHSNFELCLQLAFRSAMVASLVYDTESAGLYLGTTPRRCHAIDNETIQVSDDVIEGGQFDWTGGHLKLSSLPGHGLKLDPARVARYRYTPEAVAPHREYAKKLYANYQLDRPRRVTQAGWPKDAGAEHFDRHTYPYSLTSVLGGEEKQDVDVMLNR